MGTPPTRIGVVRSVNPARREVRVRVEPRHRHQFDGMQWMRVDGDAGARLKVESVSMHGDEAIVALVSGVTQDTVAGLRGQRVVLDPAERKSRPDGCVDVEALVGLRVVTNEGHAIGVVAGAIPAPANDVIEIERPDNEALLLPVIPEAIARIEWEKGQIVVHDVSPYEQTDED